MDLIDIVVPIYADLDKTRACLESILSSDFGDQAELQLIYDCGPDEELEHYLETLSVQHAGVYLHRNDHNLGFVKTVNKGFGLNPDRDVIILNSDTLVFNHWISRLLMIAASDAKIGTVTPFSNNAEICSFPRFCQDNQISPHVSLAWLDEQFAKQHIERLVEIPTGVGFCMWIRRSLLSQLGTFDEERFGRGYGEENDFCRRVVKAGYKNVMAHNVFVYHEGGVSFGSEKLKLIESAVDKVERKHPGYIKTVHEFIRRDELREFRVQVMHDILKSTAKPVVLAITHDLAGGTKQYLDDLLSAKSEEFETLVLQPALGNSVRLLLPEWLGESYLFNLDHQYELLKKYLLDIGLNLVFLNHIKGNEHYVARLQEDLQVDTWCVLHDYYFISGSPTLTDEDGLFLFPHLTETETLRFEDCLQADMRLSDWQTKVHQPLLRAKKVIAPSASVKKLYTRFFPTLDIDVYPHRDQEVRIDYGNIPVRPGANKFRIVVIGALNKEKGADLLEVVAELARANQPELEFHLLGYAYRPLAQSVISSGPYTDAQLPDLLQKLDPALVWYPCQWPETYSYTLSRVMEQGYPLLIPDLGALADRTASRPLTRLVPHPQPSARWLQEITDFVHYLNAEGAQAGSWSTLEQLRRFYTLAWDMPAKRQKVTAGIVVQVKPCLSAKVDAGHRKEQLLRLLFAFRQLPVIRSLATRIPIHWQRKVKRLLSSKPVHDVVR